MNFLTKIPWTNDPINDLGHGFDKESIENFKKKENLHLRVKLLQKFYYDREQLSAPYAATLKSLTL